jgi:hypothetical protein
MKWPVLIVKPHNVQHQTDERVSCWIMRAFERKIAEYYPIGTKLPEFGRNRAITEFLYAPEHAKKTHIFFLDADTEPINPHAIERLMSLDKDVVCGVTPVKLGTEGVFVLGWNVQRKTDDGHEHYDIDGLPQDPFKIDRVGGTTVLVKRRVLEKLAEKHKIFQKSEFNDTMTNIKKGEDYYFSELLTSEGFNIWCDPLTICRHYHYVDILDMVEVYRQAKQMGYDQAVEDAKSE